MPWAPARACVVDGCSRRQAARYCPVHARTSSRNHRGIPPSQRGYDGEYRKARALLLGLPCQLRLPGCTGTADTAQHNDDGSLSPACRHCNSADGAARARQGACVAR